MTAITSGWDELAGTESSWDRKTMKSMIKAIRYLISKVLYK